MSDEPVEVPALTVVLLPDHNGELCVCDWEMLSLDLDGGDSLDDAILDASIDIIDVRDRETTRERLLRVRALNETGDAGAYWGHT